MTDVLYVALTVVFFALMLAYGRACHALGRDASSDTEQP